MCTGMVTAMDDVIGNLTSYLSARGMYNDTLFVLTADVSPRPLTDK